MSEEGLSAAMVRLEQWLSEAEKIGVTPSWSSKHQVTVEVNGYAFALLVAITDDINAKNGTAYTVEQVAAQAILRELRGVRL